MIIHSLSASSCTTSSCPSGSIRQCARSTDWNLLPGDPAFSHCLSTPQAEGQQAKKALDMFAEAAGVTSGPVSIRSAAEAETVSDG